MRRTFEPVIAMMDERLDEMKLLPSRGTAEAMSSRVIPRPESGVRKRTLVRMLRSASAAVERGRALT